MRPETIARAEKGGERIWTIMNWIKVKLFGCSGKEEVC